MSNVSPQEFTPSEIQLMLDNLDHYTLEEQEELDRLLEGLDKKQRAEACYKDLIEFCCLTLSKKRLVLFQMLLGWLVAHVSLIA